MDPRIEAMAKRLGLGEPRPVMVMAFKAMAIKALHEQRTPKSALHRAIEARSQMADLPAEFVEEHEVFKAQRRLDNLTIKHKLNGQLVYKHKGPNRADKKRLRAGGFAGPVPKNVPSRTPVDA